jgi:hypothetical protein
MMRVLVMVPLDFDGRRRRQDEIIELGPGATAAMHAEMNARAAQGIVRILPDAATSPAAEAPRRTADMQAAEPRGYKRRAAR